MFEFHVLAIISSNNKSDLLLWFVIINWPSIHTYAHKIEKKKQEQKVNKWTAKDIDRDTYTLTIYIYKRERDIWYRNLIIIKMDFVILSVHELKVW